jgi:hypothetical protein
LRQALLDTDPTAFNPFSGVLWSLSLSHYQQVYVSPKAVIELPLGYFTINGDLFNLPQDRSPLPPGSNTVASVGRTSRLIDTTFDTMVP